MSEAIREAVQAAVNGAKQPELTTLQLAQQRLFQVTGFNPQAQDTAATAHLNGLLMSARLSALIEMVGQNDPAFVELFDQTYAAQLHMLSNKIEEARRNQPRIQVASNG